MKASQQKVVQYLAEARASEDALVRVLQSQIAMTPSGSYRSALDNHLTETRRHSAKLAQRLDSLDAGASPVTAVIGFWEDVFGQVLAVGKTPFDLLRGSGGEEKVLKNAKDTCATEALEISTYTALERLARSVGDGETADLAHDILVEEQAMLERVLREIPKLTDAVVGADVDGNPSYDVSTTGAGEAVREAGTRTRQAARRTADTTKRTARQARKVPGVAQAEGQVKGAVAGEGDLAISGYDGLTADDVVGKLTQLSQIDLAKVDSYERRHQNRSTVLGRLSVLRGDEPWAGYDELTAAEVQAVLSEGDAERVKRARSYERAHKNRAGVLKATERELATAQ
jgi:ferritin-like metal-binding protein YciE